MAIKTRNKGASTVVWVLMGLLILGLGGFGVTNFSGGVRAVGEVGEVEIGVNDYARALQTELQQLSSQLGQNVPFANAQALGVDRAVLGRLIAEAALDNEAARLGVSVGDEEVGRRIMESGAFQGIDGKFDREGYAYALRQQGLSEARFEERVRAEAGRAILQSAVAGGVVPPETWSATLTGWALEARDFTRAELIGADLPEPLPEPDAAAVQAYYEAHPEAFTAPEIRVVTYVWLSPEALLDEVELDEAALRQAYEQRLSDFVTPERRLVERLVYESDAAAQAAWDRLEAGAATFEELAAERGLTLEDIDLGEVTQADLGAAGEAVFALDGPGVAGPLPSPFGPALYAMNAILMAQETSFEEARAEIEQELALDRARRLVSERAREIEDLLAGGATLEDLAAESPLELGRIELAPDTEEGIAAYTAFRDAALAAGEGDFPELAELDDGGAFALRLDEVRPPSLRPLGEVTEAAAEGARAAALTAALEALAAETLAQLQNGATLEGLGLVVTRHEAMRRDGFIEGAPRALLDAVFAADEGESGVVEAGGKVHLYTVTRVIPADPAEEEAAATRAALDRQAAQGIAQDVHELFVQGLQAEAGIGLNQAAIEAVHAQIQ